MKLLLIEDSADIAIALERALSTNYVVDVAATGQSGLDRALTDNYEIIVLDLHLPDMHGLDICQTIRSHSIRVPILILSGEAKVLSKISLLDAGADDYLTKPFSLGELKVRLRALQRRAESRVLKQAHLVVGDLSLDGASHQVTRGEEVIRLRRKEFSLLECLMQNAGSVVSRQTLCAHAWHDSEDPWKNTIDVHIKYLRDKVDRPFANQLIKTVHGYGYRLELLPNLALIRPG